MTSMGRKLLLDSSHTYCALGGKIEFTSPGQVVVSLGPVSVPGISADNPPRARALFVEQPHHDPTQQAAAWSATLNQVPLVPDAQYLVGTSLYETDAEGRVATVRGVLSLQPPVRDEKAQGASVSMKDGKDNPAHKPDPRTEAEKKAGVKDARTQLQRRDFVDDGGHIRAAQNGGAVEQINYVPMHMDQNQARKGADNWHKMERTWAKALRKRPPSKVYAEQKMHYPQTASSSIAGQSMRPEAMEVRYWIDNESTKEFFKNN